MQTADNGSRLGGIDRIEAANRNQDDIRTFQLSVFIITRQPADVPEMNDFRTMDIQDRNVAEAAFRTAAVIMGNTQKYCIERIRQCRGLADQIPGVMIAVRMRTVNF